MKTYKNGPHQNIFKKKEMRRIMRGREREEWRKIE